MKNKRQLIIPHQEKVLLYMNVLIKNVYNWKVPITLKMMLMVKVPFIIVVVTEVVLQWY